MPISKIKTSSITADAASVNLNIDSGTLFLDVANNNVGIGRTSTSYRLDVAAPFGTTNLAQFLWNDGTYNPRLQFLGSSSGITINETYSTGAGNLMFAIGGTEVMRINSSGYVSVGPVSATRNFEVNTLQSGTAAPVVLKLNAWAGTASAYSELVSYGIAGGSLGIRIQGAATDQMYFRGSDNFIGINTTNPLDMLTVNGGNIRINGSNNFFRTDARYNGTNKGIFLYQSGTNNNFAMGELASDVWGIGTASTPGVNAITPQLQWGASATSGLTIRSSSLTASEAVIVRAVDDGGNSLGRISTYNYGGYNQSMRVYTTAAAGNSEQLAIEIGHTGRGVMFAKEPYATYTKSINTIDGGVQTVRFIEDCLGRWALVGRFAADASTAISGKISTVRGLDTGFAQSVATAFSADWGNSYPSEVRIMGATDFQYWKDTRTIDFIYRVPSGRTWATFFNGGSTTMDVAYSNPAGGTRYGFNVAGAYDGFGRWNNPNMTTMGMSDAATVNPSSAYSSPSANALDWYTSGTDAKLAVIHTGSYAGQDNNSTSAFGYDDGANNFFDAFPSTYSNHTGPKQFTSAVWILIKLN